MCPTARDHFRNMPLMIDPVSIDGVDRVFCRGSYDDPLIAGLVTGIKYHGWRAYGLVLPEILSPLTGVIEHDHAPRIIPVPLHGRRQRWRGFNQAELISTALGTIITAPVAPCLQRQRSTTAQATLHATARMHNLDGAFSLAPGVEMGGQCGILVDDVITTGSTTRECASVLRQAGMKHIIAVALAKG